MSDGDEQDNKGYASTRLEENRQNAAQHRRDREERERREADIAWLLKQPQFHRYMSRWLNDNGMFRSVMTGNSQTFYNSGQQDLTRKTWTELAMVDKDLAHKLLKPKLGEESDG